MGKTSLLSTTLKTHTCKRINNSCVRRAMRILQPKLDRHTIPYKLLIELNESIITKDRLIPDEMFGAIFQCDRIMIA